MRSVSILVLMDITLLQYKIPQRVLADLCFNPCFNGYYTSTRIDYLLVLHHIQFQSLF